MLLYENSQQRYVVMKQRSRYHPKGIKHDRSMQQEVRDKTKSSDT